MSTCYRSDDDRLLTGRHLDACDDRDCRGCQPCDRSHCDVCGRQHAAGVCPDCLARAHRDLRDIEDCAALLPAEALARADADPPGGDALAELADVSVDAPPRELVDDTALQLLTSWADSWSALRADLRSERPTISRECAYLRRHLEEMAANTDSGFADFAEEVGSLRWRLRWLVGDSDAAQTGAPCLDCGGVLERRLGDDGFEDVWTCRRCHRRLAPRGYWLAVRAAIEGIA